MNIYIKNSSTYKFCSSELHNTKWGKYFNSKQDVKTEETGK